MPTLNVNANGIVDKVPFAMYKASQSDPYWGRGIDGDATLGSNKNINTQILGTASGSPARTVDAPLTACTAISGTQLTVASTTNFRENDYVILMNMMGNGTEYAQVGSWELLRVAPSGVVSGTVLNLVSAPAKTYGQIGGAPTNANLSTQTVMVQRVPEYGAVQGAASVTCNQWNGTTGGLIAFICWDLNLTGPAGVDASNSGYRSGAANIGAPGGPGSGFAEGYRGTDTSPSNNNGKNGAGSTTATVGTAGGGAPGGGGGGNGGHGGGGIGGNKVAGPQGAGSGGGGGGGSGNAASGGNGTAGGNATGSTGGTGSAGNATAPGGGAGSNGQAGAAGGGVTPGPDTIHTDFIYMGGGGGGFGVGGLNALGGVGTPNGAVGSNSGPGTVPAGIGYGGGIAIIFAKKVTAGVINVNGGSVALTAETVNVNTNSGSLGGAGGAMGAKSIGAGGAGSAIIISDYIALPTYALQSGSVASRTGGPGGTGTAPSRSGGQGGASGAIAAVTNGRALISYIKADSLPVSSAVPNGVGNYPPTATAYKAPNL